MMNRQLVSNPFPPVYDEHSRILILGSMPSEASRAAGFYYMNPRNRFWKVMSALLGEDFVALSAEEKANALRRHEIALFDVIESCEIHRSSDASVKGAKGANIPEILRESKIQRIFLNGGKAYALFLRFFPEFDSLAEQLPSTSPANARLSLENLIEEWRKAIEVN